MAQQRINVQAPITRIFAERWSPRAFAAQKEVTAEAIATCLEAARWAPSCYGDQPWQFVVTNRFTDASAWQAACDGLAAANQAWAKQAPVLVIGTVNPSFHHNGKPNRWNQYDTGQAMVCFCLQATELGLQTHQMGGFDEAILKQALNIPQEIAIISVTALGYQGESAALSDELQSMEQAPVAASPCRRSPMPAAGESRFSPCQL